MKRAPSLYNAYGLLAGRNWNVETNVDGRYVPMRSEGYDSMLRRIKFAWMVFTGRADVLWWPGQER